MRIVISLLLLVVSAISLDVVASERWPIESRKKKRARIEQEQKRAFEDSLARVVVAPIMVETVEEPVVSRTRILNDEIEKGNQNLSLSQLDSLVGLWSEARNTETFDNFFEDYGDVDTLTLGDVPDSVYIARLRDMVSPIPLPFNAIVRGHINMYVKKGNYNRISRPLGRSRYYFPYIEEILIKNDLPVELRAIPIIESALSPTAISHAGASGLWQFMPATGKAYGLEVNSVIDERNDPRAATEAACRMLKDLYNMYDNWFLAIAAYNCGPGNVNKALARSGNKSGTYWDIYDYLPRETRGYVPAFIAASYAYTYHQLHGIEPIESPMPIASDTIMVDRIVHLKQISSTIDISMETLRLLNPQYRMDIIPATKKSYTLVLPQRNIVEYIEHEAQIYAKDSIYLKEYLNPANLDKKRQSTSVIYHKVKSGETLGGIAHRYRVRSSDIMRWNGLKNPDKLRLGQRLRIQKR